MDFGAFNERCIDSEGIRVYLWTFCVANPQQRLQTGCYPSFVAKNRHFSDASIGLEHFFALPHGEREERLDAFMEQRLGEWPHEPWSSTDHGCICPDQILVACCNRDKPYDPLS